ncbi:LemA family protein [Desulfocurvus sp. DL9XJH121]
MSEAALLLALLVGACLWLVLAHKRLVRARCRVYEAWGELEDCLDRRHDPALALARHAQGRAGVAADAVARVERLAERSREVYGAQDKARAEAELDQAIAGLLHTAGLRVRDERGEASDADPDEAVGRLARLAERAERAAGEYNAVARDMNVLVEAFPASIAARMFGFSRIPYYEPESSAPGR